MNIINIGLLGVDNISDNLGCQALTYALIHLIDEALVRGEMNANVTLYVQKSVLITSELSQKYTNSKINVKTFQFSKVRKLISLLKCLKNENVVFDITGGDSFSDIYGLKRFFTWSFLKYYINNSKALLVLAPQTYGPYSHNVSKVYAQKLVRNANYVFARD